MKKVNRRSGCIWFHANTEICVSVESLRGKRVSGYLVGHGVCHNPI